MQSKIKTALFLGALMMSTVSFAAESTTTQSATTETKTQASKNETITKAAEELKKEKADVKKILEDLIKTATDKKISALKEKDGKFFDGISGEEITDEKQLKIINEQIKPLMSTGGTTTYTITEKGEEGKECEVTKEAIITGAPLHDGTKLAILEKKEISRKPANDHSTKTEEKKKEKDEPKKDEKDKSVEPKNEEPKKEEPAATGPKLEEKKDTSAAK